NRFAARGLRPQLAPISSTAVVVVTRVRRSNVGLGGLQPLGDGPVRITFSPCQRHNEMIVRCRLIGQWYIRRSRPLTTRSTEHVSPCAMTSESSETRPRT